MTGNALWLKVLTDDGALVLRLDLNAVDISDPLEVVRMVRELRDAKARAAVPRYPPTIAPETHRRY